MKNRKMVLLMILMLALVSMVSFANATVNKKEPLTVHIIADEEQLAILNSLDLKNMTLEDIVIHVFPDEYSKLDKSAKTSLKSLAKAKNNKKIQPYEIDSALLRDNATFRSTLSHYYNSLKHTSYLSLIYKSDEIWVDSQLYDVNDPDEIIVSYVLDFAYKTKYLSVSALAQPATGTYKVFANHQWYAWDGFQNSWFHTQSNSEELSYVNPY